MKTHWLMAYKESTQMLRSQRGLLWLMAYSGLLSAFSLLLVSNTELSLLDNAQVVYMMTGTDLWRPELCLRPFWAATLTPGKRSAIHLCRFSAHRSA